jgi:hypothetical protein
LGSVQASAITTSVLGTLLLELITLWLAWRCFGGAVLAVVLVAMLTPLLMTDFLLLAIGQGPESWAAAFVLLGLAVFIEARRCGSLFLALVAGVAAGLAEWFRTGNYLLFLTPIAVYGLIALRQRERQTFVLSALALASYLGMNGVNSLTEPSPVSKTTVNLWHRLVEFEGMKLTSDPAGRNAMYIAPLMLAPGSTETYYDYVVRHSHGKSAVSFLWEHAGAFTNIYRVSLTTVARYAGSGLRGEIGDVVIACFLAEIMLNLARGKKREIDSLAFAAGALAHYLGPLVLLRGDDVNHYLLVPMPLFLLVAARGAVRLVEVGMNSLHDWRSAWAETLRRASGVLFVLVLMPFVVLSLSAYRSILLQLAEGQRQVQEEQSAIDALGLDGKRVACRNMTWFIDRPVVTVLLPYATVPELEQFARGQAIDGILYCGDADHEVQDYFRCMPYSSTSELDEAMQRSSAFGPARVSGGWRWYPVRRSFDDRTSTEP